MGLKVSLVYFDCSVKKPQLFAFCHLNIFSARPCFSLALLSCSLVRKTFGKFFGKSGGKELHYNKPLLKDVRQSLALKAVIQPGIAI